MELEELQKKIAQLESDSADLQKQLKQKEILLSRAMAAIQCAATTLNLA